MLGLLFISGLIHLIVIRWRQVCSKTWEWTTKVLSVMGSNFTILKFMVKLGAKWLSLCFLFWRRTKPLMKWENKWLFMCKKWKKLAKSKQSKPNKAKKKEVKNKFWVKTNRKKMVWVVNKFKKLLKLVNWIKKHRLRQNKH